MTISAKDYFKDQVIIITGASSGIGRAAALKFAGLHAKVVLAARNEEKLVVVPGMFFPIGALNNLVPRFMDWVYRILRLEGEKIVR